MKYFNFLKIYNQFNVIINFKNIFNKINPPHKKKYVIFL